MKMWHKDALRPRSVPPEEEAYYLAHGWTKKAPAAEPVETQTDDAPAKKAVTRKSVSTKKK